MDEMLDRRGKRGRAAVPNRSTIGYPVSRLARSLSGTYGDVKFH